MRCANGPRRRQSGSADAIFVVRAGDVGERTAWLVKAGTSGRRPDAA
jgi:hypothetical protein